MHDDYSNDRNRDYHPHNHDPNHLLCMAMVIKIVGMARLITSDDDGAS